MRKNHPPAQLIMLLATSEMTPEGNSRRVNRRHRPSRYTVAASLSSVGMECSAW